MTTRWQGQCALAANLRIKKVATNERTGFGEYVAIIHEMMRMPVTNLGMEAAHCLKISNRKISNLVKIHKKEVFVFMDPKIEKSH